MPTIALATVDLAGGIIQNTNGISTTINGSPVATAGDLVTAHPPCPQVTIHCAAIMTASSGVTINGIAIVVNGDPATCAHTASASANSTA